MIPALPVLLDLLDLLVPLAIKVPLALLDLKVPLVQKVHKVYKEM